MDETDILPAELKRLLASDDPAELLPPKFPQSVVARHGLAAAMLLQFDDQGASNVLQAFYLDTRADRRCAILRATVAHLHGAAKDAEAEWKAALADNGAPFGTAARATAGAFLSDQIEMLKTIAMRKMAVLLGSIPEPANPTRVEQWQLDQVAAIGIADSLPRGQSGRAAKDVALNLGAVRHALISQFGVASLLPPEAVALTGNLHEITADLVASTSAGVSLPAYLRMIYPRCCFSPCPDLATVEAENADWISSQGDGASTLVIKVNELRMLLQHDVAAATGLTHDLRELETDEL